MKTILRLLHPNMSFNHTTSASSSRTFFFLCLPLLFPSILASSYTPDELLSINCGNTGISSGNDRTWTGDVDTKFLSKQDGSVAATALTQSSSASQVPYTTARLSRSQFSYSFPVSPGQKFLRIFFYPASYPGFDRFDAFFTVKSGDFTLLKDYNASLTADANRKDTILMEYCINVGDGERLNLTFTPNSTKSDFYAFVNGIEIVSMPEDLYYTKPDDLGFKFIGSVGMFNISDNTALQLKFRLNVGGGLISAMQDTGMLRSWDGDDSFVIGSFFLPTDIQFERRPLVFSQVPNYTAPEQVYRTERDMGKNKTVNVNTNLTWVFPVDSGFTYMLRLHFCELNPDINISYNRQFNIYIADQLAEDGANVLNWGKGKGVPVYRDYAVVVSGYAKSASLSLKMHPTEKTLDFNEYSDAFLNGLEIFKISDSQNNLAGPNPGPLPPSPANPNDLHQKNTRKSSRKIVIGVIVGVAASVLVLISSIAFFLFNRGKKASKSGKSSIGTSKWAPFSFATTKSGNTPSNASSLPMELCRHFSIAEIRAATNNFDELFKVGVGGFGNVYKGYIDGGLTPVAIKRLKPGSQQGVHEFKTEIEMLSQLRHSHLVSLIGYCYESNEMILVYDFMARGTLRSHLYSTDNPALPWKRRLQICIGAARGLHYLHTGAKHMIIHRDVKTTNILIDDRWEAKVSDFGLSRIGPTGLKAHVSTVVKGSIGYLDPEYYKRQHLTEKSDVYSFGVVLFEVLCGRPPIIRIADKKQVLLSDWAMKCFQTGNLGHIVDPALKGTIAPECLRKFGEIGVSCLLDDATQRPTMNDVVWGLEFALQLQENVEKMRGREGEDDDEGGKKKTTSGEDSDSMFSGSNSVEVVSDFNKSSEVSMTSSTEDRCNKDTSRFLDSSVFSEILDPKAR
ncbi:receptor-like protein kinase FERONIA [Prosopis cineraria]|uniref:receptor-like protein kinase FERONIA n=1 Tax=Prosopis cineraria TaxID=364024 RepID=UPI00241051C2|nr:receptor-like protein kinase FERONIA [Prosopis cineraria]